jgi:hypothetical protein
LDFMTTELMDVVQQLQHEVRRKRGASGVHPDDLSSFRILQLTEVRNQARRSEVALESTKAGVEAREAEIRRLQSALTGHGTTPALAAGAGARTSLNSIAGFDQGRSSAVPSDDYAAIAASNARVIAQMNEQIDFLTAELAARDTAIMHVPGANPGEHAFGFAIDAESRVAALELEVTRLSTRLESSNATKERAEKALNGMREEVCPVTHITDSFLRYLQRLHFCRLQGCRQA